MSFSFGQPDPSHAVSPIQCLFNAEHRDDERQTFDGIFAECHSGHTWCPICGRRRLVSPSSQRLRGDREDPCPSCSSNAHPIVGRLRRVCIDLKDAYFETLVSERPDFTILDFRACIYANKRWLEVETFHEQCVVSITRVADALRSAFPDYPDSPVKRICELKFFTTDFYHYSYCAFALDTTHGCFVFDPTGPQFGHSWPVVSRISDYRKRVGKLLSCKPLGTHKKTVEQSLYFDSRIPRP